MNPYCYSILNTLREHYEPKNTKASKKLEKEI